MDVCVLTGDLMFFTAVEGVAGAMGHVARQVETLDGIGQPDVLFVDMSTARMGVSAIAAAFEPLRTAIFTPHERVDVFTAARAHGIAHVHRRGALASELPRIIAEYAV
jgi:hypothetical protein